MKRVYEHEFRSRIINMKNNNSSKHHAGRRFGREYTMKPNPESFRDWRSLFRRLAGNVPGVLLWLAVLPLAALGKSDYATPYTITTLAGLAGVAGTNDGTGSAAQFNGPGGVAVDTNGNVYVGDQLNDTIRQVTAAGVVTTLAGLAGTAGTNDGTNSAALFNNPWGVAVDTNGNVYVADWGNHTIREVTPEGTNWVVTTLAGLAGYPGTNDGTGTNARFRYPNYVAVDTNGNVYVADTGNQTIRQMTPEGTNWVVTTLAGLAGVTGSTDGTNSAARFDGPTGVAVDPNGNLYVADYYSYIIRKVTPEGTNWVVTTLAGVAGAAGSVDGTNRAARFNDPEGLGLDSAGNLYVGDTGNNTIRILRPEGTNWVVTTLAGVPGTAGSTDGTGKNALFNYPGGEAVDSAGNLYVGDTFNNTIRKGIPASAVPAPILGSPSLSAGQLSFAITGYPGSSVKIESSSNLSNWQVFAGTYILTGGSNSFSIRLNPSLGAQFYRAYAR
jgi:streptogramin lyase